MKKSKISILLLSLFFMFIGVVSAKDDPFILDWREKDSINLDGGGSLFRNLQYRDGYLTIYSDNSYDDYNYVVTYVRYYDIDGNVISEKKLNNMYIIDAITNDDNVYMLVEFYTYDDDDYYYEAPQLIKLDDNFNVEVKYDLSHEHVVDEYDDYKSFIYRANYIAPSYGMSTLSIVNDCLYILGANFEVRSFDLNLETIKRIKTDESVVKKYFPSIYYLAKLTIEENIDYYDDYCGSEYYYCEKFYDEYSGLDFDYLNRYGYDDLFENSYFNYIAADTVNGNTAYSKVTESYYAWLHYFYPAPSPVALEEDNEIMTMGVTSGDYGAYIGLLDSNGEIVWEKENSNYAYFTNVKIVNGYIVAIGVHYEDYDYYGDIVIYDLDGKVVQTIESNNKVGGYDYLSTTKYGFLVTDGDVYNMCKSGRAVPTYRLNNCGVSANTEHYAIPYNIIVNVEGEGEVKANEQSFASQKQTIEVTYKEGYRVESVIVTDSEGNNIDVEDNSFIMPASDVTIFVKIVKDVKEESPVIENPNTNAFPITGIIVITIGLGIIGIRYFQKLKFLK